MKKRTIFQMLGGAVAATILLAGAANASPAKLLGDTGFLSGPGARYDALANLDTGDKVDVIWCGTTEDWCLVSFHNRKGWVPLALLNLRPGGGGSVADSSGGSSGGGGGGGSSGGGGSKGGMTTSGFSGATYTDRSGPNPGGTFIGTTTDGMAATKAQLQGQ